MTVPSIEEMLARLFSVKSLFQMKQRREGEDGPKKRVLGNRKKTKQDSSDEEDECAADSCQRPNGEALLLKSLTSFSSKA